MQMRSVRVADFHPPSTLYPRPENQTVLNDLRCETRPDAATMSFFGKLKSCGSPAPPRTDNSSGWPQDEFDEEEGDVYEAPPCERPVVKVQADWRKGEENLYLERMSSPEVPQRQAAPPPRSAKASTPQKCIDEFKYFPNTKKPPEIDRNEKPGRQKTLPPPRGCPAPLPPPSPECSAEEDVYLDPNEEQDEELYLEPTAAACAPMRTPQPPRTAPASSSMRIMKPPVPRAKSNLVLSFLNEVKAGSSVEVRRATFLPKVHKPTPDVKPASLKEAKPSPSSPLREDTKPVAPPRGRRSSRQHGNEDKEWFTGDCNRKQAEDLLLRLNKDGAFLIRPSSAQGAGQPYTLAVLFQQKVYNVPVRFLEETRRYALGKEGKKNEEIFATLDEIISHHRNNYLLLIDSKSQAKHKVCLTHPANPSMFTM
ncbi:LOW QUALITY PROTEIN: SH2 domain-containing protein 6 [Brachionichthys hirsutus]|uniref:LOW QUALITY PROTEIN: SH2 domain-containing protein 6 n=1 Tax=Brachionichthys hirsutus TaxID=412623 RepID=UPI0036045212